jgi:hypothetical protein
MKVTICDKCNTEKGKLVKTNKFMKVPKHPELRVDLCEDCMKEVAKLNIKEYVILAYKLTMNMDLEKEAGMRKLVFLQLNIKE